LSQQELAAMIGKTASAMSKYEAGQISEVPVLIRLAEALGQPVGWLLHGHRSTAAERHTPNMALRESDAGDPALHLEVFPERVRHLPARYRERYVQRAREIMARAQRELEEYTTVLDAEYRTGAATRRRKR